MLRKDSLLHPDDRALRELTEKRDSSKTRLGRGSQHCSHCSKIGFLELVDFCHLDSRIGQFFNGLVYAIGGITWQGGKFMVGVGDTKSCCDDYALEAKK